MKLKGETHYDHIITKLKDNKLIAVFILIFIILTGVLTLKNLLNIGENPISNTFNVDNSKVTTNNLYTDKGRNQANDNLVKLIKSDSIYEQEISFQLLKEHKGVKEIRVNKQSVSLLINSTNLNPRIIFDVGTQTNYIIEIITISGDTCITNFKLPKNQCSPKPSRIIPNCF